MVCVCRSCQPGACGDERVSGADSMTTASETCSEDDGGLSPVDAKRCKVRFLLSIYFFRLLFLILLKGKR